MAKQKTKENAKSGSCSHTVIYPKHAFDDPKELLVFIEHTGFTREWEEDLGLDDEDDLSALQIMLMVNPQCGDVISGTGGLRKMRYAPARWKTGKSGAARVCYVFYHELGIIYLVTCYKKSQKDDLSESVKKIIKQEIEKQERLLSEGFYT